MSEVPANAPLNADAEVVSLQAQATASTAAKGTMNASTMVPNSMAALKREAPEMYRAVLEGIANTVLSRLRQHDRNMKRLIREGYKGSQ